MAEARNKPTNPGSPPPRTRAARLRVGRGGRMHLDRHLFAARPAPAPSHSDDEDAREHFRRYDERWRYDGDDTPAVGAKGPEEQHRQLVDEYDIRYACLSLFRLTCPDYVLYSYLPHRMGLLSEHDQLALSTDPTLTVLGPDGRPHSYVPFKLGGVSRREHPAPQRPNPTSASASSTPSVPTTPRQPNGAPAAVPPTPAGSAVSMPLPLKSMPSNIPSPVGNRVPSGGAPRPPSASVPSMATPSVPSQASLVNGSADVVMSTPSQSEAEVKLTVPSKPNGALHAPADGSPHLRSNASASSISPSRPKSQNQHAAVPVANNFQFPMNGYPAHLTSTASYVHPGLRSAPLNAAQQLQAMKTPFASLVSHDMSQQVNANAQQHIRTPSSYMAHVAGNTTYQAQMAAATRQMQWVATVNAHQQQQAQQLGLQRMPSVTVVDPNGIDASMAAMMSPAHNSPPRVPSSNGSRTSLKPGMTSPGLQHAMSPPQGRASPANQQHMTRLAPHSSPHMLSPSMTAAQVQASPSRPPPSTLPSPSLQSRQAVGGTGAVGY